MICQRCQINEASVMITQVINGERTDFHLCAECAKELGLNDPFSEVPSELLQFILTMLEEQEREQEQIPDITCENCGLNIQTLFKKGMLGCIECYPAFEEPLKRLLRRFHGTNRHLKPKSTSYSIKVKRLKDELKIALEREDFESAARLRDKINLFKKTD
ncbi:MAG: UvrB/UvrC motif-containing protein [candidate division Zixibacteria bacterium]|nr:UvrB/UvrC motif-containing protein [Candidatus Tariuqbacter arcticus]